MSLNWKKELSLIAKHLCSQLRTHQTKSESLLWEQLRNRKFQNKKFLRQHPIFFDYLGKETFYIADFYCHEHRLVLEIDGKIHDYQKFKDREREEVLNHLGFFVLRINNEDVENNLDVTLEKINKIINSPMPLPAGRLNPSLDREGLFKF